MQHAGKIVISLALSSLTQMDTAAAPFSNLFVIAKVKRRMEMVTECPIEHAVVILTKDILLSLTQTKHATAIL